MVARERDGPVCQLFTVRKKPTIKDEDAEDEEVHDKGTY